MRTESTIPAAPSPLSRLADLLEPEMEAVNALILRHMDSDVSLIPKLAGYLIAAGGKRIRPLLTLAAARLYGETGARPHGLSAAVEFIHTATLLHDDVVDESPERRGKKSAHIVFGNQASVLVGDFLFSRAFQLMVADGSLETLRILSDAAATIAEGEVLQLSTANNLDTTIEDYLRVIESKTAALFAAACECGPVVAGANKKAAESLAAFGLNLGIAFQIADDVLDYDEGGSRLGKKAGDDFAEGKMTAPLILALKKADERERRFWERTVSDKIQTPEDFEQACDILHRHGTFEEALSMAHTYANKARAALPAGQDKEIAGLLTELCTFAVDRQH